MARGRQSRAAVAWGGGTVSKEMFNRFMAGVAATKQDCDDANMANAAEWKKADQNGINKWAAKVVQKLDKMESTKRDAAWRALKLYGGYRGHFDQADLFEEPTEPAAATAAQPDLVEADAEEREPAEPREPAEATARPEPEPVPEVEADEGEETTAEATEELAGAGFTFAAGKQAAMQGEPADTNPHPDNTPSHPIWARGHAQGLKEAADPVAEGEGETVVPMAPRGRRGRAAVPEVEPAASLH